MNIWLYCVCRNEAVLMPYLLRHYVTLADKLIFYDAGSTDGTAEMLKAEMLKSGSGVELREWPGSDELADDELHCFASEAWREARGRADWVCWIDADEFLVPVNQGARLEAGGTLLRLLLARYLLAGVTLPQVEGYTMVSDGPPTKDGQIYDEIRTGFPDPVWAKSALFQPCVEMAFHPGRHSYLNHPSLIPSATKEIRLLHYRALGLAYLKARHERNWARVPPRCRERNLGVNCEPGHEGHHGVQWFEEVMKQPWPEVV